MRLFFIALCLLVFSAQAQIKLPPKQNENKTPAKQTVTETKPANTGSVFTLKVMSNADCKFYVDGELQATLTDDEIEKIQLKPGEYQFKAVSINNSADVFKEFYTVTKEQVGTEKFYEIDVQSSIDQRLKQEAGEQAKAEKYAVEKEAKKKEAEKEAKRKEYEKEVFKNAENLKPFEGKILYEISWENVPENMKEYYKKSTHINYYKEDKTRIEVNSSEISKVTIIYDYGKNESLALTEMNISGEITKTATLQKIKALIPTMEIPFSMELK